MKSIAMTKPDMTVARQEKSGLSPFGILSAMFTRDVIRQSEQQIGQYSPLPLLFLEEEAEEEQRPRPELTVNFDLEIILKAIREEQEKREKEETRKKTPEQRICSARVKRGTIRKRRI